MEISDKIKSIGSSIRLMFPVSKKELETAKAISMANDVAILKSVVADQKAQARINSFNTLISAIVLVVLAYLVIRFLKMIRS